MLPPQVLVQSNVVSSVDAERVTEGDAFLEWVGFIYNDQGETGESAARRLLRALASGGQVPALSVGLKGSYFAVLKSGDNEPTHSFVDASGLFSAYFSPSVVGTSFLAVAEMSGCSAEDIDDVALAELIHLGNVYFGRTLVRNVCKLKPDMIVRSSSGGSTEVTSRPVPTITEPSTFPDVIEAIGPVARAAKAQNLSVDLTGGVDSRMLAAALNFHGVKFETALSGIRGHEDHVLGEAVADALGVDFHFSEYDPQSITEGEIENSLVRLDGLGGLIQTNHRLTGLQQDRRQRGITTSFKGAGGELYKDFFWTQDFPFFRSRKTRLDRLNRLRLEMELLDEKLLTPTAVSAYRESRAFRVERLDALYAAEINTASYDNIYYHERVGTWGSRTNTSTLLRGLNIHAPLCEPEVVRVGYHAKRRQRFHSMMHRRNIAAGSTAASRVMSTDGTRPSPEPSILAADFRKFAAGKSAKLVRKIGQLTLNRTLYDVGSQRSTTDSLQPIRESKAAHDALLALKESNIVVSDASLEDFSPRFQEHVIVTGYALQRLVG